MKPILPMLVAVCFSLIGAAALAQAAGEQVDKPILHRGPGQAGQVSRSSDDGLGLEEVIVTAQKRNQRIQDVPLSVAVVSAEEIDRRGLVSAEDYLRGTPGVNQTDSGVGPSIVIRGLETTTSFQNTASGSTVATYFGETPTTTSAGIFGGASADIKLVDIERVEVLRGPQGTAFGSSSLGGVVRTIPVEPSLGRFEGRVGLGWSVTSGTGGDNQNFEAIGNIPLIGDKLAIRVVGYRFDDSGFYRNVAGSDPELQGTAAQFGAQAYAKNEKEIGASTFTGGRIAALFQPGEDLKFTLAYLKQKTELDGWAGSNRQGYQQAILRVGPEELVKGSSDTDIELANAVMEYDFGWGDLLATYSHVKGESGWAFPFSARPPGVLQLAAVTASQSDRTGNTAEIRVATRFEGSLNFLVGLYSEKLKDFWGQPVYWYGSLASSPFPSKTLLVNHSREWLELDQTAAFGEVSWQFLRDLTLTGGVRYYDYDRSVRDDFRGDLAGLVVRTGANNASDTNFRANLSYKLNEDSLVYAGWAEGFRLGKPQAGLPSGVCDVNSDGIVDGTNISIASTLEINSDSVDSYEIGGKFSLLDRRLMISADVFHAKWNEIPVSVQQQCGVLSVGYTANAGRAISEGVEAQATFQVTKPLRVNAGASWIDAHLTEDVPAQGFRAGDRLPSPKVNANLGLEYAFSIGDHDAYLRADSIYVGRFYSSVGNRIARNLAGDYVKLDTSIRVAINDLNIDLIVDNLLNADDTTYVLSNNNALRLRPRTFGIQMAYEF